MHSVTSVQCLHCANANFGWNMYALLPPFFADPKWNIGSRHATSPWAYPYQLCKFAIQILRIHLCDVLLLLLYPRTRSCTCWSSTADTTNCCVNTIIFLLCQFFLCHSLMLIMYCPYSVSKHREEEPHQSCYIYSRNNWLGEIIPITLTFSLLLFVL